jgi:hypothetical protein
VQADAAPLTVDGLIAAQLWSKSAKLFAAPLRNGPVWAAAYRPA